MCGIAGIYCRQSSLSDPVAIVKRMLSCIWYRGPDESGIYLNKQIVLGSVRLSIIDIHSGKQPMSSEDGKYWIVFNGEIYNYIELKAELIQLGYKFISESDTEVLLHAFIHYGQECLNKLTGQFVFAIWNNESEELFIARDRMGIRPFFYTWVEDKLIFGSEIKAIFEYSSIKAEIDPLSISQIFTFWTTITPRTYFQGIYELPPGHYLKVTYKHTVIQPYWELKFPIGSEGQFKGSLREAAEELEKLLTDAVRLRLRADVPVAAYLSGGIDSSATTALIKKVEPTTLQTFSIGFEDSEFDETPYQQEVSKYLDTRHNTFTCSREDIGYYFPQVVWHTEIPVLRTAPVPMFCLSRKVKENNIKVVITGEGADEILAGYDIFKEGIIREFWSRQPDSKYRPLLLWKLYPYLAQFKDKNKNMLKFFFGYQLKDLNSPFYSHTLRWKNTSNLQNLFASDLKETLHNYNQYEELLKMLPPDFEHYNRLNKSQWLETVIFMSGYLLSSQGDRVSMANSVEGRYPFLDHHVVEFASTLPNDYKMHGLNEKYILKRMMNERLPDSILKRPKQAYRSPIASSFMSSTAKEYTMDLLSESDIRLTGMFSITGVQKLLNKLTNNEVSTEMENMALTGILSSQMLYHQYILKDGFRPNISQLANCRIYHESNTTTPYFNYPQP
jgi:asparagine synthase (glutamine-hydrolysing)